MSEIADLRTKLQELGQCHEEMKSLHENFLKTKDVLIKESVDKATADVSAKHEQLSILVEKLAAQMNRTGNSFRDTDENTKFAKEMEVFQKARIDAWNGKANFHEHVKEVSEEEYRSYTKAFNAWMRYGEKAIEQKALSVGSDPDGGTWIVPPTIQQTIINRLHETSPIRDVAMVVPLGTHSLKIPQNPNEFDGGWVSETAPRSQTKTPVIAMKEIVAQELFAEPPVSQQLLEDSSIDVEAWVGRLSGDKLSRIENTSFVIGTGVGQPRGFLTYPAGSGAADVANSNANKWGEIQQVGTGSSGNFTYDAFINLIASLKEPYQANASFLLKRQSVAPIMTLKDGNGRYIFQPILNGNFNQTPLFGYMMRYAADMPTPAANSLSLAFGDFKQGYYIVDRVGLSMIRDNVTAKPFILFYMRKRTGGDVVDFDAIKLLKLG